VTRTASIATLGCKTNRFESASMEERLAAAGFRIIPFEEGADLVIVNTCTVTAATDSQSRNLVRRARRLNPDCRVVVTGCYAQVDPESLRSIPGVSAVLGNSEKKDFLDYIGRVGEAPFVAVSDISAQTTADVAPLSTFSGRSRAFVQIQNGCNAFCSYCIIPYARGPSRSVPPDAVLEQVKTLAATYPEIVLTGIHIGGYGLDLDPATTLCDLIQRIVNETPVKRLRLGSIEPTEISDALIDLVATSKIVCPHFHIPLQSGCDTVLARMNRHYTTNDFRDLVERIRAKIPDAAIGLDVIVGFPAETDAEFEETRAFIASIPATHLHVFPFSRRPGTPAADMEGQLTGDVIRERAAILRGIGETKTADFCERFVGRSLDVVVEGEKKGGLWHGLTPHYLTVAFPGKADLAGKIINLRTVSRSEDFLHGNIVEKL